MIGASPLTLFNGFFTLICGFTLLYSVYSGPMKSIAFKMWILGFFFYGAEIILRAFGLLNDLSFILIANIMTILFVTGTGIMLGKEKIFFSASILLFIADLIFYAFGLRTLTMILGFTAFYFTMSVEVILLYFQYREKVFPLSSGWILLMISNFFAFSNEYVFIADLFSMVSKFLLILGLIKIEEILPHDIKMKHYIDKLKSKEAR